MNYDVSKQLEEIKERNKILEEVQKLSKEFETIRWWRWDKTRENLRRRSELLAEFDTIGSEPPRFSLPESEPSPLVKRLRALRRLR